MSDETEVRDEDYFAKVRHVGFESTIHDVVSAFVAGTPKGHPREVVLRYITHVMARELDEAAKCLIRPTNLN